MRLRECRMIRVPKAGTSAGPSVIRLKRVGEDNQEATLTAEGTEITMRVLAYTWAGVRTADLKSAGRFFTDLLGFSLVHEGKGLVQFEVPSGQLFEIFDSESHYYNLHACPVLAFQVEDVRAARKELESRGVEFITDIAGDESEAWTYFRGPDGYLYELWQTARPLKELSLGRLRK